MSIDYPFPTPPACDIIGAAGAAASLTLRVVNTMAGESWVAFAVHCSQAPPPGVLATIAQRFGMRVSAHNINEHTSIIVVADDET